MAYELIETIEVGSGGASSIEFTSIPQDGVDLVLKVSGRGSNDATFIRFNSDTGSNYPFVFLSGEGGTINTFGTTSSRITAPGFSDTGTTANTFGNMSIYISNYTSTTDKSISIDGVEENNASSAIAAITAASYSTSSSITSIEFTMNDNVISQYSTFSLYKIY